MKCILLLAVLGLAAASDWSDGRAKAIELLKTNKVAIFGRSRCGLTVHSDKLLTSEGVDHLFYKYDLESDGRYVSGSLWGIGKIGGGSIKLPFSFVCGKYIGSYYDIRDKMDDIKKQIASPDCQKDMDKLE